MGCLYVIDGKDYFGADWDLIGFDIVKHGL